MKRFGLVLLAIVGCQRDAPTPSAASLKFQVPPGFPQPVYTFDDNPVSEATFQLGRKLFYEPLLSATNDVSCHTCHAQVHGFADHGNAVSTGILGRKGRRNSPALANLAWYPTFMHDGGIVHLEQQPLAPIQDTNEMGETLAGVIQKLESHPDYPALFESAFGSREINSARLAKSLAQFMAFMVSANSRYDQFIQGKAIFTEQELRGLTTFRAQCATCHTEPLFTDFAYRNNGLALQYPDPGRAGITQNPSDVGRFKTPSLRNVELTYPYMHNGQFFTLENVVQHYAQGVQPHPNLGPGLNGNLPLSTQDQADLVAFLLTLTDHSYMANLRLSEPR
jgi:cytochrome c peroxidase